MSLFGECQSDILNGGRSGGVLYSSVELLQTVLGMDTSRVHIGMKAKYLVTVSKTTGTRACMRERSGEARVWPMRQTL